MDSVVYASVAAIAATTGSTLLFPPSIKAVINGYVTWIVLATIISIVSPAHKFLAADTLIWIPHYISLGIAIRRAQLWLEFTSDSEDSSADTQTADSSGDENTTPPTPHINTPTSDDIIAEYIDNKKSLDEVVNELDANYGVDDNSTLPQVGHSPTFAKLPSSPQL